MAKANQRFVNQGIGTGLKTHSKEGEYKIPIKDRKEFMGSNRFKWVVKKTYLNYLKWKKEGRPKIDRK